jgi:alpha-beta hydrolase superfamily lysophospholipase
MVACSSTEEAEPTASSVADAEVTEDIASPPGDFYAPPDPLPDAPAGTLIWAEEVGGIDLNPPATVWRILYHSRSEQDQDIAVSGFALVPTAPAPAPEGDRAVYGWAHGTVGQGDQCAPSREVRDNLPPYGGQQVERGAVLVATDYEGVGTPGVPTTTDGVAEGHAVLDSVRAVSALPDVGPVGDVVLAGHSQGGVAVLFAGELAPTYAPELDLVGIVALAPGGELPTLADAVAASPYRGLVLIGASGMRAGHPDLDLSTVLTPDALADLPRVESECLDATIERYQDDPGGVTTRPPSSVPEIERLLEANSPGSTPISTPVFLGHGAADQQVPPAISERLGARYCALGADLIRRTYPGQDHDEVIDAAAEDVLAFITARYHREPAESECT